MDVRVASASTNNQTAVRMDFQIAVRKKARPMMTRNGISIESNKRAPESDLKRDRSGPRMGPRRCLVYIPRRSSDDWTIQEKTVTVQAMTVYFIARSLNICALMIIHISVTAS